jgi:glycosyltransferase involved in cell wall biosynthesis
MRISIVIPVLNSHEVLRRQFLYLEKIGIPEDTEIIIVDDGSEPPLTYSGPLPVKIIATNDKRAWTWALARNRGAKEAKGEWLVMFDVDHFISPEIFEVLKTYDGDKVVFSREFGVIDEDGNLKQDLGTLVDYGFDVSRFKKRGLALTALPNNFAMKRKVFMDIGGYREDLFTRPYPQGEDRLFKKAWLIWERANGGKYYSGRPKIYMFPNGYLCGDVDADPKGLFHNLTRKTRRNLKWQNS